MEYSELKVGMMVKVDPRVYPTWANYGRIVAILDPDDYTHPIDVDIGPP